MTRETPPSELLVDRRRSPRYFCNGQVQITSLPLNGILLGGRIRDLGLGGCRIENIEATAPLDLGDRTEILVKVNSWLFRAMAHVRAVHDRSGISLEFVHMSAGGYGMLEDLIEDLERPRPGLSPQQRLLVPARERVGNYSGLEVGMAGSGNEALVGTILPAESDGIVLVSSSGTWDRRRRDLEATIVDIFA